MSFARLDAAVLVAPQLGPGDVAAAAAAGVSMLVNNRPDGEEPGQPGAAAIAAAARAAGLAYRDLPFAGLPGEAEIAAMARLLEEAEGPILLFCRSGTRSTWLWALASARLGADPEELIARAAAAGYDLRPLRSLLG